MDFKKPTRPVKEQTKARPEERAVSPAPEPKTTPVSGIRQFLVTKKTIILSVAVMALVSSFAVEALIRHQNSTNNSDADNQSAILENLEYQTLLPSGKSISELGGWKRVSPQGKDPVYAYTDSIDGVTVSVSQQPLPQSFLSNTESELAELAKKFNATTEIDAGSTKVYVGISAKGPQSAILTKNSLLIMIKSQKKIDDKSWAKYVESLN